MTCFLVIAFHDDSHYHTGSFFGALVTSSGDGSQDKAFFHGSRTFYGLLLWFPNCILSKQKKSMNDDSQLFAYTSKIRKTES